MMHCTTRIGRHLDISHYPVTHTHERINVAFITSDASAVAGVGPALADALEFMDRSYIEPFIICPRTYGHMPTILPRLTALECHVFTRGLGIWLPSPHRWGARHLYGFIRTLRERVWSIAILIEQHNIDIVYSNGLPCIDGAIAAHITKRPHIWHLHEAIRDNPDLRRYLPARVIEETVARLSDTIIVNSIFLANHLFAPSLQKKTRVIHNGVDLNSIASPPQNMSLLIRQELGIPRNAHIVLAVGTVAPRKGYDTLVRAAHRVLSLAPDTVFLVAGAKGTDHTKRIVELIASLGLNDSFRLLGPRSDIPNLLATADMLVHSARQETFGRVLVEAMAACKPVISTRCGGPEEIVLDGETGILVPPGDFETMADAIVRLLRDQALAQRMGTQGRLRAASEFSVEAYTENIVRTIESVVRGKPGSAKKGSVAQ